MATRSEASRLYPGDYLTVFWSVRAAAQAEGMTVKAADPSTGTVSVGSSVSAFSWGENAYIHVSQPEEGKVLVAIHSQLKFGLVDWGKNKRNIDKLFAAVDRVLGAPAIPSSAFGQIPASGQVSADGQGAAPGWHPDPMQRHESRYWDGSAWTVHVSDGGAVTSDPI